MGIDEKKLKSENQQSMKELRQFLKKEINEEYFPGMKNYLNDKEYVAIYYETKFTKDFCKWMLNLILLILIIIRCFKFLDLETSLLRQNLDHNGHFFESEIPVLSSIKQFIFNRYESAANPNTINPTNLKL